MNTRDPPDFQELLISLGNSMEKGAAREGERQEHGMGKAFEESSYTFFICFLG